MHLSEDNIEGFDEDVENTYATKSQTDASMKGEMDDIPYTKAM